MCCCASSCKTCSTSSVTFLSVCARVPAALRSAAEKRMFSRTVRPSCTTSSCGTKPMMGCSSEMSMLTPLTSTEPVTSHSPPALVLPQSTFRKVVLPAPEGPMMADMRPASNWPLTLASTTLSGTFLKPVEMPLPPFIVVDRSWKPTETVSTFLRNPRKTCSFTDCRLKFFSSPAKILSSVCRSFRFDPCFSNFLLANTE